LLQLLFLLQRLKLLEPGCQFQRAGPGSAGQQRHPEEKDHGEGIRVPHGILARNAVSNQIPKR
jgi:hypothetical protein